MIQEEVNVETDPMPQMVHYIADMLDNPVNIQLFNEARKHAGKYNKKLNLKAILCRVILQDEEYLTKFKIHILTIFNTFILDKNFSFLFKHFLYFIQDNEKQLNLNYEQLINNNVMMMAKQIRADCIMLFLKTFKLDNILSNDETIDWYKSFIINKQFDDAFVFYKEMSLNKEYFDLLIKYMDNNESCSKAGQFIKKMNFSPQDYPQILKRQKSSTTYYYYRTFSWYKCEELLRKVPDLLVEVCYLLDSKDQLTIETCSIIQRQNLIGIVDNMKFKIKWQSILQQNDFQPIQNIFFSQDDFIPSDILENSQKQYLTAQQFGYEEQNVIVVEEQGDNLTFAIQQILKSEKTGCDTEFISPMYQLDNTRQELQIIQIANSKYAFIFDFPNLMNLKEFQQFIKQYIEDKNIKKIGHTINEDLKLIRKSLQLENSNIVNVFDISLLAGKVCHSNARSLAAMSEIILKKPLSKMEQRSSWNYRPLRRAQIHYAAMDAIVCLEIFNNLQKTFEKEIKFYHIDSNSENNTQKEEQVE